MLDNKYVLIGENLMAASSSNLPGVKKTKKRHNRQTANIKITQNQDYEISRVQTASKA